MTFVSEDKNKKKTKVKEGQKIKCHRMIKNKRVKEKVEGALQPITEEKVSVRIMMNSEHSALLLIHAQIK